MANIKVQCAKCDGTGQVWTQGIGGTNDCGLCGGSGILVTGELAEIEDIVAKLDALDAKMDTLDTHLDTIETKIDNL